MRIGISLLAALLAARVDAQTITTGEITGMVMDQSGAIVAGASVLLKNVEMGESRTVQSNAVGIYRFAFVRPGTYEVSGASAGLKSDTGRLIAAVGQVQVLDLSLKIEPAKEVVVVTDSAPLLQTDNANTTYSVSSRQLELLPLPGGDLVGVVYSMPGVVINNRYGTGNFASQGIGGMSNLFTVNGVDDMDPYYNINNSGVTGLLLGANEIREHLLREHLRLFPNADESSAALYFLGRLAEGADDRSAARAYYGETVRENRKAVSTGRFSEGS
jgi:hypothetical protein